MPIYDYTCARCGHLTEVVHGIHEAGPKFCPNCGADGTMRKAFAPPTVHFKGSGWAKKDRAASAAPGRSKPAVKSEDGSGSPGAAAASGSGSGSAGSADGAAAKTSPAAADGGD